MRRRDRGAMGVTARLVPLLLAVACGTESPPAARPDAGADTIAVRLWDDVLDGGAGPDTVATDTVAPDAKAHDTDSLDASAVADSAEVDSAEVDSAVPDAAVDDAATDAAATDDAGPPDAAPSDALADTTGPSDTTPDDASASDTSATDAVVLDASDTATPDAAAPDAASDASDAGASDKGSWVWPLGADKVSVSWQPKSPGRRQWTLKTTHPLRDNDPASKQVTVHELPDQPVLRTGHAGVDAVYALAVQETRDNSALSLTDGAFNQGKPVACACFATGAKWPWAWTRDSAYAVALGLADLDLPRSAATLLFKTAERKTKLGGGGRQLVQDTGTGGSWPVSTDRVVWAIGAEAVLHRLTGSARADFVAKAYPALKNTLATDRASVWDPSDGLYRGEESFLDWREQSYPSWTKTELTAIAGSKALSTNVLFWLAHDLTARLAKEAGESKVEAEHAAHAKALKSAILKRFAVAGTPLLSALVGHRFDPGATARFDLLGNALAIHLGLVDAKQAAAILSAWPLSPAGPPVQWPQQPGVPIYHNRAIWPFVTAFHGLAARSAQHAPALSASARSITEFAALNLSHMENLEFLSGKNYVADGALSGPVVNSRRQLWSVAAMVSLVHQQLFGVEVRGDALRFMPSLPRALRAAWFAQSQELRLEGLVLQGRTIDLTLVLPPKAAATTGLLAVKQVSVNGKASAPGAWVPYSALGASAKVVVTLADPAPGADPTLTTLATSAAPASWLSPPEPTLSSPTLKAGKVQLSWSAVAGVQGYDVFRDGALVAEGVKTSTWTDPTAPTGAPCYAVAARLGALRSHRSRGQCWWGPGASRILSVSAYRLVGADGTWTAATPPQLSNVGTSGEAITVALLQPEFTGEHALQLVYRNPHGGLTTGIACATARVRVERISDDKPLAEGVVAMPQQGAQAGFVPSTTLTVALDANEPVRVLIDRPPSLPNMSALAHYDAYNGGAGGGPDVFDRFDLQALRVLALTGKAASHKPALTPDGKDDLNKLGKANQITPGITLAPWERFGLTWDARDLYLSVVSKGFEQGDRPFILYLQGGKGALPQAKTSVGMTYLGQTPKLPFTPTWAIALRSTSDLGDGVGPWAGVFERTPAGWVQRLRFEPGVDSWLAQDKHTLTARIPRALVGALGALRMAGHLVWAQPANEWKDVVPPVAMPWKNAATGYYELDLGKPPAASGWSLK